MKNKVIILVLIFYCIGAKAFEIKGVVSLGKSYNERYNGQMVYLFKNEENKLHKEWDGNLIIDSCIIKNNKFVLSAPNTKNLCSYRVSVKSDYFYYFVNKDECINIIIKKDSKYRCFNVETSNLLENKLVDSLIYVKEYKDLNKEENKKVLSHLDKSCNYIYQQFIKKVNAEYFNPYLKRKAINYLKSHIENEAALYLIALYSSSIPDRFHAKPFFTYKQLLEVLNIIPEKFHRNPYYKKIIDNKLKLKASYKKTDGFVINGYIHNVSSNYAVLILPKKGTAAKLEPVDTVEIINGYFKFKGKLDKPKYAIVSLLGASFHKHFFLDNSDVELNLYSDKTGCNFKNGWLKEKVWGVNFYSFVNGSNANNNYEEFKKVANNGYRHIEKWISKHPKSYPALIHLSTIVSNVSVKTSRNWLSLFDESMKNTIEYKYINEKINIIDKTGKGAKAPNFKLESVNGKKISLKSFRGKYVLLDFWASWCGPCKAEVPNIKKVHNKYKDKGLVVIGISSDQSQKAWRKSIKHEKMSWLQLITGKSTVSKDYGITGIPHIVLINKKGEIIATGLRGKNIMSEVSVAIDK